MAPTIAPVVLWREIPHGSNPECTIVITILAEKSIQSLVGFYEFLYRFCAYSTESIWLLLDGKMSTKRVWRLPEVILQTGLSRSTIYEMIKRGEFPRQFKLGTRAVGWVADDVLEWLDAKILDARHLE